MPRTDDDILEELKDRYADATSQWADIREEGAKDMRAVSGDPWPKEDRDQRDDNGRPCLSLDELGQYTNQVINDVRSNKRGITVTPRGNGANDATAKFRQGKIRDIEYQSNAQQAYTTMLENAVQRGYGYLRIKAQYCSPDKGFDQELVIEPVVNPDLVTPDPDHIRTDGKDLSFLFYEERRGLKQFAREFPDATIRNFDHATIQSSRSWIAGDSLRLAEYWTKEPQAKRTLLLLKPGPRTAQDPNPQPIEIFEDAINGHAPSADQILKSRSITPMHVWQYLTNGVEILQRTRWLGPSIPFVCCYGKVIYLQNAAGRAQRVLLSMIRLARDPFLLYCYYRTCQAELVGMTPKFPYFVAKGQLDAANLQRLADSLNVPVAVIEYLTKTPHQPEGGLGPPTRQPYEPPIQELEIGAEGARRAIQAAIGASPLPSAAQRHNDKSGVALKQIEDTAQKGSFHFVDHHDEGVTRAGAILDECIPLYYDTARDTSIRDLKDQPQIVRINDPAGRNPEGLPAHIDTAQGEHDVTISVGPKKDSEREAASDFADQVIGNPQLAQVVGPQKAAELIASSIRLKNLGPIGDEMAETIAPKNKGQVDPRQAQQQLGELHGQLQKLQQVAADLQKQVDSDQVKIDGQIRIKTLELDFQHWKTITDNAAKIEAARITASKQSADLALELHEESIALDQQIAADDAAARHAAAHDVGMAALAHAHALEQGRQAHAQALEQGDQQGVQDADLMAQGHQQALEAQAAAPAPEAGA
jgi:hypothetical protein